MDWSILGHCYLRIDQHVKRAEMSSDLACGSILEVRALQALGTQTLRARYLDYLNKVARDDPSLKTEDFPDLRRAP